MFKKLFITAAALIVSGNVVLAQPLPTTRPASGATQQTAPDRIVFYQIDDGNHEECIYLEIRGRDVAGYFAKGQHFGLIGRLTAKDLIEGNIDVKGKQVPFTAKNLSNGHVLFHAFDMDMRMTKAPLPPTTQPTAG